jgi:hypothetical protein
MLAGCGVMVLCAGCHGGEFQGYLAQSELEQQVSIQLVKMSGRVPDAVHCAGPLEKLEGKTQHCTVTKEGHTAGLTAIASDVRQDDASCRISLMADEPIARPNDG